MLTENNKKIFLVVITFIILASLAVNGWLISELYRASNNYNAQQKDMKVLVFTNMFVENVLMAKQDIDFDTRLTLENAVRDLNDSLIFDQWQRFTKATTKEDASNEAKNLLNLLIKRVSH